ncbi:MAG: hypothetical protein KatS3mg101_0312 [Patescibacteria group bacterium]|nr:MAG: hypothetical protein KatS3mg101_0312 [Patescibacteria group bacterium]
MNLRSKTIYRVLPYVFFILSHVFLFNVNTAEWGDSYRILRASEYIRAGAYPDDEKRPPLYSVVLALRPESADPIQWGRGIMFIVSLAGFFLFDRYLRRYVKDARFVFLGMMLLALNPDFLYWSIRIMADAPFAILALLAIYLYKNGLSNNRLFLIGIIVGLSVLTRFEGYLLAASLALSLFLCARGRIKPVWPYLSYLAGIMLIVLPWIIYRPPLSSKYFDEPAGRKYDLEMIWVYFASLVSVFGFVPAFAIILDRGKEVIVFLKRNIHIASFLLFELALILLWPAAIPRLFVAIIPVLIIIFVVAFESWWENGGRKRTWVYSVILMVFYVVSQYFLKLQFLVLDKKLFAILLTLQFVAFYFLAKKKFVHSVALIILIMLIWSYSVIWMHKDIFISVKNAAEYAAKNLQGKVAYNDVSSVSDFYLNVLDTPKVSGFYYNTESKKNLTFEALEATGADYFLITNEHNTTMELDLESRPYLIPVKDFSYNVNGADFFAKIVRFSRENRP